MNIQGQFVLETYFVMVIYGLIVCGNIMLIEAGDSKGEVSKMNVLLNGSRKYFKGQHPFHSNKYTQYFQLRLISGIIRN